MTHLMALGIDPGWAKCGIAAVARTDEGVLVSAGVRMIQTSPNKDKRFERLRVSMDDERRLREYYEGICRAIEDVRPHVLGVEAYTIRETVEYEKLRDAAATFVGFLGVGGRSSRLPFATADEFLRALTGSMFPTFLAHVAAVADAVAAFKAVRGRGAAAKTYGVYAAALCAAYRFGLPVYVFMPVDLKKRACRQASAGKKDVEDALCREVQGLRALVDTKIRAKTMHEHVFDAAGHAVMALEEYSHWLLDNRLTAPAAGGN